MEERPLRLITLSPLDALARTIEALLVVASAPLPVEDLAAAADDDTARVEAALRLPRPLHASRDHTHPRRCGGGHRRQPA